MVPRILVRLRHDPCRCVGDTEIQHLARPHEVVETLHQFFDRGRVIPPVQEEDVNVVGLSMSADRPQLSAEYGDSVQEGYGGESLPEAWRASVPPKRQLRGNILDPGLSYVRAPTLCSMFFL